MAIKFVVLLVIVACVQAAKLPSFFTKCKKSDPDLNACVLKNAKEGLPMFALGDNAYHIQSVSPLLVPYLHVDINGGLIINLKNAVINGFEQTVFEDISVDLEKQTFTLKFGTPYLRIQGDYDINGKILILPITGAGDCNVTYIEPSCTYTFNYDLKERNNKEYIAPKETTFEYTTERVYFQLDNLFNGDKRLGEQMAKFLDENWKEVNAEIGTKFGETIGEVLSQLLGNFFDKVPISEMIDD